MARGFTLQNMACLAPAETTEEEESKTTTDQEELQEHQEQSQSSSRQQPPPRWSEYNNSSSGGLLGFSWFDKQKEKRRREHLKLEAEKQLQKIAAAHRAARLEAAAAGGNCNTTSARTVNRNHSLVSSSSSSSQDADMENNPNLKSNTNGSRTEEDLYKSNSFGTSDVSKSGEGAVGMLDLSDIDVEISEQSNDREEQEENDNKDDDEDIIPPVRVTRVEGDEASPYVLSQDQMNEIAKYVLPETITYCRWRRLYGLGRDGDSFDSCLRIIGGEKRTLMVVRTTKGDVFGGYADAPWHSRKANATAHFYGSASSCLFSFSSTRSELSTSSSPEDSPINVYRWTGKNRYIQVCDVFNKMLGFGGGGDKGSFGLCLQEDFQRGTTGHCDTFDNDPLCSGEERTFDVVDVEFWEFLTGVF